jgi:hypothetical protein
MAETERILYNLWFGFGVIKSLKLQSRFDMLSPKRPGPDISGQPGIKRFYSSIV